MRSEAGRSASDVPLLETYRGVVYPGHCDAMGHLPTFRYLEMFDAAGYHFFFHLGLDLQNLQQFGLADVRQEIQYKEEVRSGALLLVRSGVLSIGHTSIRSFHLMTDAGAHCEHARLETVTVHFDLNARTAAPLPADLRERAEILMSSWRATQAPA